MRTLFPKCLLAATVCCVAALGADNSIGTWKLNTEKSKYSPGPLPVKTITSTREAADSGVKVTNTGERADGAAINTSYTATYDGTPASVTGSGAPYDTISIKQVNANTFTEERRKSGGSYHSTGRTMVSKDGKTLTWSGKGTDENGKPFTITLIYEKQ